MDEVLSKRQGCHSVGIRAAAHSKRIVFALAGIGVFFFLFVLCYTTWTISLRTNLQAANKTADGLLSANNDTGPDTISNITSKPDGVDLSTTVPVLVQTTHPLNDTVRLTTPRFRGGRKKSGGRIKMRKTYRKQIHQLLSKLLGKARVGSDENERTNARNSTNKKTKKKSGRPKYRVVLPGRRRKKNRNAHRKTSPQRPPGSAPRRKKGRGRLKGDRKSRPKVPGCEKKGRCTQNETDVKQGNSSTSSRTRDRQKGSKGNVQAGTGRPEKGVKPTNNSTESSLVGRDSDVFNLTTQTPFVDVGTSRGSRLNDTSNINSGGDYLKQTEDECPDDGDQSQEVDSKSIGSHAMNSSRSEPCSVAACNSSDTNASRDGKLERTEPEARLSDRENSKIGDENEDDVAEDNDEEADVETGDKDYGYEDEDEEEEEEEEEEEGWKSNMETVFAEIDREKADEQRNALSQVKWNQSRESDTCDLWIRCKYNSLRHYLKQLDELPGCPCIYPNLVWNNQLWDDSKESYFSWETANSPVDRSDIYKPGAKFCIRSLLEPGMMTLAAQHCCYDNNQQLITRGKAAGTPNLISPQISWELHRKVDILPWIICKGDWYRYHKVVPPNNSVMCKSNPEDTEFYRQVLDLKNI